jgi:hypothetical protein
MATVTFELPKLQRGILESANDESADDGRTLTYGEIGQDGLGEFVDVRRDAGPMVRVRDAKEIELVKAVRDMHAKHSLKHQLLEHYARKEPKNFIQFDGFSEVGEGDFVMQPDADGDWICGCPPRAELMEGTDVRILISEGASRAVVCRLLRKMLPFVEEYLSEAYASLPVEVVRHDGGAVKR